MAMSHRAAVIGLSLAFSLSSAGVRVAAAQERGSAGAQSVNRPVSADLAMPALTPDPAPVVTAVYTPPNGHVRLMLPFHVSTVLLQALDVQSTLQGLKNGALEGNPLMAGVVNNRAAFIATKAAITAGLVYGTHGLAKRNKFLAIAASVGINAGYAYVVSRNFKVVRQQQGR
jgi:Domain of unknown function (DUF5658)